MNRSLPIQSKIIPKNLRINRGFLFGFLILGALLAFEIFNYSTTEYALSDLMGMLSFAKIHWATILAIAFCGIDFAGIARLFTPEQGSNEPREVWYLFGAWLLAATMNAALTWYGVSIAIMNQDSINNRVVDRETLVRVVPVFVAVMVWIIRILIIGTFSVAGERLFSQANVSTGRRVAAPIRQNSPSITIPSFRPSPKLNPESTFNSYSKPEPTYHPVSMSANQNGNPLTRR